MQGKANPGNLSKHPSIMTLSCTGCKTLFDLLFRNVCFAWFLYSQQFSLPIFLRKHCPPSFLPSSEKAPVIYSDFTWTGYQNFFRPYIQSYLCVDNTLYVKQHCPGSLLLWCCWWHDYVLEHVALAVFLLHSSPTPPLLCLFLTPLHKGGKWTAISMEKRMNLILAELCCIWKITK